MLQSVEDAAAWQPAAPDHHPVLDAILAALPGWHHWFAWPAASRPLPPGGAGLAILSRLPLEDRFHLVLPAADCRIEAGGRSWQPAERQLIGASVSLGGRQVQLLDVELEPCFRHGAADGQALQRRVLETVLRGRKGPVVLAGGINAAPEEGTLAALEACGMAAVQKRDFTWRRQPMVLDHLLHSPDLARSGQGVVRAGVSDHDAVRAVFRLA
jgi:endonuclease/exonuclease/phosphatase family metal-dependent hydrolase